MQQNNTNRKARDNFYKGVFKKETKLKWATKIWRSYITANKKQIFLGCYSNARSAALAYNYAAIKYHGEFARLNYVF